MWPSSAGGLGSPPGHDQYSIVERFGTLELEAPGHPARSGGAVVGYVRPHDLDLARERNGASSLEAIVQHVHPPARWSVSS